MGRAGGWMAGAAVLLTTAGAAAESGLQPHRAAYRLSLADGPISQLSEVRGGLVIEWQRVCDGWLSHQRLSFLGVTGEGERFGHDVRFSSWEALDGSRLRYSVRRFEGDRVDEEYRGEAVIEDGAGGVARFTEPEDRKVPLPPGTMFPTEHLERVLSGAAQGRRVVTHEVFDGWGFDALTQITSVIGEAQAAEGDDGQAWPVSMAYYNVEAGEDVPDFEAGFLLQDDGVLRELTLDYGDFRVTASLENLELLEPPDC